MAMPALEPLARRWTAREVRELIAASPLSTPRYELVGGELLVTPSPTHWHQEALRLLVVALSAYLEHEPVGHLIFSPSDVELEPEFLSQPDLFVVPLAEWRRLATDGLPVREVILATEVLSPSSGRHDRVHKRPMYQRQSPDYWIVDLEARLLERWRPADERPEILTSQLVWNPRGATTPFVLDLAPYFAKVFGDA